MIAEIIKAPSCSGMVEYNEQKVEEGHATRIINTTLQTTPWNIKESLNDDIQFHLENQKGKNRLSKNKFQHVVISFHQNDNVPPEAFEKIWNRYCEEMEYKNFSHVVYQHSDTHLNHYHIVMPTVDMEGKKMPDFNDFINNRDICRKLEKEHDLHQIIYEGFDRRRQHSMNADSFSIYNVLRRKEVLSKESISIPPQLLNTIRKYKLDNDQVKEIYYNPMGTDFDSLKTTADKYVQSYQGELLKQIRAIKNESSTYKEFEQAVKDHGLYIRRLKDQNGSYRMVYGNKESSTYIKNNKLPKDLRYQYLFTKNEKEFTKEDQIKFLRNIAIRCSKKSKNFDDYQKELKAFNIDIDIKTNKNVIYAYSLKSNNVHNAEFIPSGEIYRNLTVAKLPFNKKAGATIKTSLPKAKTPSVIKTIGSGKKVDRMLDTENDAKTEEAQKRKAQAERAQEEQEREL